MNGQRVKALRAQLEGELGRQSTKGEFRKYKSTHRYGPLEKRRRWPREGKGGAGGFHLPQTDRGKVKA